MNLPVIKLDEDLSPAVGVPFVEAGCEVRTVRDQGWGGLSDDAIYANVVAGRELLVTGDKGFANILKFPPGTHPGILLLRPDQDTVAQQVALVQAVLREVGVGPLEGAVTVATPRSIRLRTI